MEWSDWVVFDFPVNWLVDRTRPVRGTGRFQLFSLEPDGCDIDRDAHAEIALALADDGAQGAKRNVRVLLAVDCDDVTAAAADQLVNAEIVEMAAVGEVDVAGAVVGAAKQLFEQVQGAEHRPAVSGNAMTRIADPAAQPDVESRKQAGDRGRGMIAHVGADRGPGKRDQPQGRVVVRCRSEPGTAAAAIERAENKRFRFSLLPGQLIALGEVHGSVDEQKRSSIGLACVQGVDADAQSVKRDIISGIEARDRVRLSIRRIAIGRSAGQTIRLRHFRARGTQVATNQAVGIQTVQGEGVDVDAQRHHTTEDSEPQGRQQKDQRVRIGSMFEVVRHTVAGGQVVLRAVDQESNGG